MPQDSLTPEQLVAATLETVMDGIEHGDLSAVEGRLSALVKSSISRPSTQPVSIWKVDAERRMVYGWALVSTVGGQEITDRQNDVVSTDDVREAAHDFISKRTLGRMHEAFADIGDIRESMVLDKNIQDALGIDLGMEGWFVGVHVKDDSTWDKVKKGELCAFSIGGTGTREPMEKLYRAGVEKAERMTKDFRPGPGRVTLFNEIHTALAKFNPNHAPAGSSAGGQFAGSQIRGFSLGEIEHDGDLDYAVDELLKIPGVKQVTVRETDFEDAESAIVDIDIAAGMHDSVREALRHYR